MNKLLESIKLLLEIVLLSLVLYGIYSISKIDKPLIELILGEL